MNPNPLATPDDEKRIDLDNIGMGGFVKPDAELDYQKLQQIYLNWHNGHRPLSGYIKELEAALTTKYIRKADVVAAINTVKDVYYVKRPPMDYKEQIDLYCKAREDLRAELRQALNLDGEKL